MRVVEVAMGKNGEMSHTGVQVEYAAMGSVTSVRPLKGAVGGGTVVTVGGSGFVAGRTACKFGSGSAGTAEVVSSVEARCVAPARSPPPDLMETLRLLPALAPFATARPLV